MLLNSLVTDKSVVSVQEDPFHNSVLPTVFGPPKTIPEGTVPQLAIPALPEFKSVVSDHDVPFQVSTKPLGVLPSPLVAKAAVSVPNPVTECLPVFKSAFSVQDVPFHSSV